MNCGIHVFGEENSKKDAPPAPSQSTPKALGRKGLHVNLGCAVVMNSDGSTLIQKILQIFMAIDRGAWMIDWQGRRSNIC